MLLLAPYGRSAAIRDFKMPRGWWQRERQKSSWLNKQNNNSALAWISSDYFESLLLPQNCWEEKTSQSNRINFRLTLYVITLFYTFLCHHSTATTEKCLISRFIEDVNKQRLIFFSLSELLIKNVSSEKLYVYKFYFACLIYHVQIFPSKVSVTFIFTFELCYWH